MNPLDLPLRVPEGSETLALLERIARAVEDTGKKSEEASQKTETAWDRARERIRAAADTFNETREAVSGFVEMVNGAVEHLASSASEAERLSRAGRQLGLDFEAAAQGAGGYVDSLEVATAASTLAERGIRLTQSEINGLTRVAQNYARTTGKEFSEAMEMVTEVVTEGGEEMGKLDTALLRVADTAQFTSEDRLKALVDRAGQIAPTARTAEESMRAFEGALRDADRTFATGFVETLASFNTSAGDASEKVRELKDEIHAAGATAADVVTRAGSGVGILVGAIVAGLGGFVAMAQSAGAAVDALIHRQNVQAAAARAFRDSMSTGITGDAMRFVQDQLDRLERMDADRTSMAAPTIGGSAADARRDAAARTRTQGGGGGGGGTAPPTLDQLMQRAQGEDTFADQMRGITGVARGAQLDVIQTPEEREAARLRAIDERNAAANQRRSGGTAGDMLDARESARQRRELEQQVDAMQSYTDRMRDLHGQRADAARLEAEAVTMGFDAMGQAMAKHVFAFATGRESIEDALQGMLADTLTSVGQEAIVKGAMEFAEGAAMLAGIYTAPLAPGHFAAGAAFMGVGALAAAAGAALTPSSASPGSGASAAPAPRSQETFGRPANDNDNGGGRTVVNHYYAPVIGGRDALDSEVGQRMSRYQDAASSRQVRDRGDRSRRAA